MVMSSTVSSSSLPAAAYSSTSSSSSLPPPLPYLTNHHYRFTRTAFRRKPWTIQKQLWRISSSDNRRAVDVASPSPPQTHPETTQLPAAADIVRGFYDGINRHDLDSVEDLIADNCVYEDLIFPQPFVGRKAILGFFKKFNDSISRDLQFVIDDISADASSAVGVTWHLEWNGKPFPFSRGCSFYRMEIANGKRQIIYGRDSVEPAIKPGESALGIIRGVTWLLQQFPQLADRL